MIEIVLYTVKFVRNNFDTFLIFATVTAISAGTLGLFAAWVYL